MTINRWRKAVDKLVNNIGAVCHFEEVTFLFLTKNIVISLHFSGFIVEHFKRDQVKISIKYLAVSLVAFLHLNGIATIDSNNLDIVSRSDSIHMRVIGYDLYRSRALALRYILQQLLKLNILFVSKHTHVVNQLQVFAQPTVRAHFGLLNAGIRQHHRRYRIAFNTSKCGLLHLGINF